MGSSSSSQADEDEAAAKNCENIHQSAEEGIVGAVRHFLRADPESLEKKDEDRGRTPLHLAAGEGRVEVVALLLRSGASVEVENQFGRTPLHLAAENGHVKVVALLLRSRASMEVENEVGRTPLHLAARNGRVEVVVLLLRSGAPVEVEDEDGQTPLHLAADKRHVEVVVLLLRSGASMEVKNQFGRTPLHVAARNGRVEMVALLLRYGASMEVEDEDGETALHDAAQNGRVAVAVQLLSAGAMVDAAKKDGQTPLHVAAENGHATVVELLISAGATVDEANKDGRMPLHGAAGNGHAAVVELLIFAGATVDAVDRDSRMPLHGAAGNGHAAVVELLIFAGATVDAVDRDSWRPLHLAARNGHAAVVEPLIFAGATVDAVDRNGQTPYHVAETRGSRQVMGLLRPVFVALLSGRSCRCNSLQSRTVLELKEEAEKKFGVKIKHIIGQDHEPLDESRELAAAQIVPGSTLTAVISEEEIEEAHPEAQVPTQAMPEDSFEMKDFGHGIRLMALQRIFDEFSPKVEVVENWNDLKNVSVLEQVLPAGHVPLGRLLRLTPEDQPFPVPVEVLVPTCAGADTVWRSTSAGWEKVDTVAFDNGRATVLLDHFCDLVITGKCIPLKGLGFVHPEGTNAQIVIMHIGCESCQRGLELLCSDEDVLQPLRRCGPSVQLGTFTHNEELEIQQAGRRSKVRMRFDKMPLSRRLHAQSGLHFDVDIDGENHCFEAPLVPGPPTPAPQLDPHLPSGHPAGSASQVPAVPRGAVGSSGVPNPLASTDGHLMLSGRFNRDEILVREERMCFKDLQGVIWGLIQLTLDRW